MKRIFTFLFFSIFLFSCEPESHTSTPTPPIVKPTPVTEPDPLEIDKVFPAKNDLGDIITIKGKNFSRSLVLSLNDTKLDPVLLNDSIIKFRIPFGGYDPFDFQLKLQDKEQETILHNPFQLYAPVIDSIAGSPRFDERVVLYGKHLTNYSGKRNDILFLDDMEMEVLSHSPDSIVFHLGWKAQKYEYDVLVKAQLQEVRKPGGLKIAPPAFKKFSKTAVEIGEVITIHGSNFYLHRPDIHEVSFQGNRAKVIEAYRDSLIVKIPMGPYKTRDIKELKVKLFDKEPSFNVNLNITSTWYMYGYKRDHVITGGSASVGTITRWSFSANDAFYFNVFRNNGNYSLINNILYKYTPETDNWEEINLPISSQQMDFGEVLEFYPEPGTNNVFIYIQRDTNNFYKFNVQTRELVELKKFPSETTLHNGIGFYFNGKFYYGLGYTQNWGMNKNKMFWRYDPGSDSWTEIGEMPDVHAEYVRDAVGIFRTNNSVILANGHEYAYDLWEFSTNETWSRKNDVTSPAANGLHIQKEQKGFFYNYLGGDFYEYDIPADHWKRRDDIKIKNYPNGNETMFIHGDHVYYVGYLLDYGPEGTPYFRYDHAILRTELSNF